MHIVAIHPEHDSITNDNSIRGEAGHEFKHPVIKLSILLNVEDEEPTEIY